MRGKKGHKKRNYSTGVTIDKMRIILGDNPTPVQVRDAYGSELADFLLSEPEPPKPSLPVAEVYKRKIYLE